MKRARALVLCLCVTATLVGQGVDLRDRALGEVRMANGEAWIGAEVVLISRVLPDQIHVGEPDVVRTRADERGRFRGQILRGPIEDFVVRKRW